MKPMKWIEKELKQLESGHLGRKAAVMPATGGVIESDGRRLLNFSSNDYLDLAHHPAVIAASREALDRYGAGSTASRLVAGTLPLHEALESRLALHKGYPAALLFGSGYLANAGVITSLVGRGDRVYADRLAHASIVDAAILSRARLHRFRHNDPGHLADLLGNRGSKDRALVVTESVFSMDGDLAPLRDIARVARENDAMMMVDEAHATGVFGPEGAGVIRLLGIEDLVDLSISTLGKALGGYGGYAACSDLLRTWFVQRARSFIYTTAPPPAMLGAALGALDIVEKDATAGDRLLDRAARFRQKLQQGGLDVMASESQIIPILAGSNETALRLAQRLREQDILTIAIRPPTVPDHTARLRLSVTLAHTDEDLATAADRILAAARKEGMV